MQSNWPKESKLEIVQKFLLVSVDTFLIKGALQLLNNKIGSQYLTNFK